MSVTDQEIAIGRDRETDGLALIDLRHAPEAKELALGGEELHPSGPVDRVDASRSIDGESARPPQAARLESRSPDDARVPRRRRQRFPAATSTQDDAEAWNEEQDRSDRAAQSPPSSRRSSTRRWKSSSRAFRWIGSGSLRTSSASFSTRSRRAPLT